MRQTLTHEPVVIENGTDIDIVLKVWQELILPAQKNRRPAGKSKVAKNIL